MSNSNVIQNLDKNPHYGIYLIRLSLECCKRTYGYFPSRPTSFCLFCFSKFTGFIISSSGTWSFCFLLFYVEIWSRVSSHIRICTLNELFSFWLKIHVLCIYWSLVSECRFLYHHLVILWYFLTLVELFPSLNYTHIHYWILQQHLSATTWPVATFCIFTWNHLP